MCGLWKTMSKMMPIPIGKKQLPDRTENVNKILENINEFPILTLEELCKFFNVCRNRICQARTPSSIRRTKEDLFILYAIVYAGLRNQEVAMIKKKDINFRNINGKMCVEIPFYAEKTRKERVIYFSESEMVSTTNDLVVNKKPNDFVVGDGMKPITIRGLIWKVNSITEETGLQNVIRKDYNEFYDTKINKGLKSKRKSYNKSIIHPHYMRHWLQTVLLQSGCDIDSVAKMLAITPDTVRKHYDLMIKRPDVVGQQLAGITESIIKTK